MSKVIEINNLSKVYDLGLVGTGTLSKDLNRTWARLRGKPDPYATLVELNDRTKKSSTNMVYALKDISFSVEQGEVLGIIGKNGAGKSTLLKILSQITSPSTGSIKIRGRVASLLEVGTGMHPEMTARQNIYLNGSLMGMRRHEITATLDEIVEFAGIGKYIDTPIKRFSSGMSVRLGFAIAAFLDPEILIVDEVLAVGDAEFQKRAIGKMKEVSNAEGRTVIFVSHNLTSVRKLCNKGILLENGTVKSSSEISNIIQLYTKDSIDKSKITIQNENFNLLKIEAKPQNGTFFLISSGVHFSIEFYLKLVRINLAITIEVSDINENIIFHHGNWLFNEKNSENGNYKVEIFVPGNTLNCGKYKVRLIFAENFQNVLFDQENLYFFEIHNEELAGNQGVLPGFLRPNLNYNLKKMNID